MQVAADARRLTLTCEARYRGQVWQLTLPVPVMRISGLADLRALVDSFHRLHEGVYAVRSQNDAVEITEWNLQAVGLLADVELPKVALDGRSLEQAAKPRRMAYFREVADTVSVPVFDGRWMPPDAEIAGPAIVDEPLTTIVVPPAARIHMSVYGNYLIDLD
jgi:N-methylhydantoinase A